MSFTFATLIIQSLICLVSLYAAIRGRTYFYGFLITFGIYFYYNLNSTKYIPVAISNFLAQQGTVDVLFLIAAISGLVTIWKVYKRF